MRGLFLTEARVCVVSGTLGLLFPGFLARTFVVDMASAGAVRCVAALLIGIGVALWGALASGDGIRPVLTGLLVADLAFLAAVASWTAEAGISPWAWPVCGFVAVLAVCRIVVLTDDVRLSRLIPR